MGNDKNQPRRRRIEDEEWWQEYSRMVWSQINQAQENEKSPAAGNSEPEVTAQTVTGIRYIGSGSGSLGIRYIGSGSGSLGIRYVGSGSGSLGIRYVGSGSGSLGIRYVGSGSGSLGIRYVGSGSGSLGIRYIGSGSGSLGIRYVGSAVPERTVPEEEYQDPYTIYDRSKFPGEGCSSNSENDILGYGLDLI